MICSCCGEDKKIAAGALCAACYSRLRRRGTTHRLKEVNKGKTCSAEGCAQPATTKGLCMFHYQRAEHPAKHGWKILRSRNRGQYPPLWDSFDFFLSEVGERPSAKHQLRRIDPRLPYSKENVHWLAPVNKTAPKNWSVEKRVSYHQEWNWRRYYGLSREDYDALLTAQNGVCAICKQSETQIAKKSGLPRALHVDHDHVRSVVGKIHVRGLTCSDCNTMLGLAKDDPALLRAAAVYLDAHAMAPASTETIAVGEVRVTAEPDGGTISWTETPIAPLSLPG